jgi:microsomal epoxide hydrolase
MYVKETIYPPPKQKSEDDYRKVVSEGAQRYMPHNDPKYYCHQPLGYSWFPREIVPIPKSWASTTGNLVWSNKHTEVSSRFR